MTQGRFAYEILQKYPHFNQSDAVIWSRFVSRYPDFADSVDYDVICGSGHDLPDTLGPTYQSDAKYLGSYKIDVLAHREKVHYIIEVKPNAGPGAIGQIITYAVLFDFYDGTDEVVKPVLITDFERPDVRKVCERFGVEFFVV